MAAFSCPYCGRQTMTGYCHWHMNIAQEISKPMTTHAAPDCHVQGDAAARKAQPVVRGCIDYFPDALLAVAELSRVGNEQHNPGQPLHWAKEKSTDEADALVRHLIDRGKMDSDGIRHSAKVAWRALALLQREIERERGFDYDPTTNTWRKLT